MDINSLLSGSSGSVDYAQMQKAMFSKVDTDADGQFSLEEFTAAAPTSGADGTMSSSEVFSSMDANADGYVSQSELKGMSSSIESSGTDQLQSLLSDDMLSQLMQMMGASTTSFENADTDGDDQLSLEEFTAQPPPPPAGGSGSQTLSEVFDDLDTNEDGYVSQSESMVMAPSLNQNSNAASQSQQGDDFLSQIAQMISDGDDLFASADTDGDGQLSEEEFAAAAPPPPPPGGGDDTKTSSEVFDDMDVNEDGYVSQSELMAMAPSLSGNSSAASQSEQGNDFLSQVAGMMGDSEDSALAYVNSLFEDDDKSQNTTVARSKVMSGQEFLSSIQDQMKISL